MVKSFRLEEESMGDMRRVCPFCKSKKISVYEAFNTYVFKNTQQYICHNCGCVFEEDTICRERLITTKISKEEFFDIIFTAIRNIKGNDFLSEEDKNTIEKEYLGVVQTFYKEVAHMQAEAFYEADCKRRELLFIKELKSESANSLED